MVQRNEVLTGKENRISFIAARRTTMQEDCLTMEEGGIPMSAIDQTCVFEVGKETCAGRTTPELANALVKITKWLNHLGSGKIDESGLESRHNIHHNFRINGIGR